LYGIPNKEKEMATRPVNPAPSASHVNLIDAASLFAISECLKQEGRMGDSLQFRYSPLLIQLAKYRRDVAKWPEADLNLAPVTLDLRNEKQIKFLKALDAMGITTNPTDYRQSFVSAIGIYAQDFQRGLFPSVATQLAYTLGLLAGRKGTDVVIVTGVFDIYVPLKDYVSTRRGGKASLAFFKRFLDPRWEQVGLVGGDSGIGFLDLEPFAEDLLGLKLPNESTQPKSGLERL
jgi:hypothetical protein